MRSISDTVACLGAMWLALLVWYSGATAGVPARQEEEVPRTVDAAMDTLSSRAQALELFIEGGVLAEKKRHSEAIGRFRQALELDPRATEIALPMAESFLETSLPESARVYAERALSDSTNAADALRILARCDMHEGDAEGAIARLQQARKHDPTDQWTLLNLLSLLQRRGRIDEALALIEPAIPENLATAHVYTRRAALRSQLGRHADAVSDLAEALSKNPEYPGTEAALVQELARVEDPASVAQVIRTLLSEVPDLVDLRRAWIATLSQAEEWDAIGPELDAYLQLNPRDGKAQLQAGLLAMQSDRLESAEGHLVAAAALLETDPDPYRWIWRLAARQGSWSGALAAADSLLARSPGDIEGLWFRGLALHESGRSEDALPVLGDLVQKVPEHRPSVFLLSALLSEQERWEESAAILGAYLQAEPEDPEALLRRGIALERTGRGDESSLLLEACLRLEPTNHVALNYLGYMWIEKGYRFEEAMNLIRSALELDPGNPAYLDSYGWGYFLQADYETSIRYLERAVERGGDHPEIRSHLGRAYEAVGRREEALFQYRKALQYNPEDPDLLERVGRLDTSDQTR